MPCPGLRFSQWGWPDRFRRGRAIAQHVMIEDTGDQRPIARGYRFDCAQDINEKAGPLREERCHNVATTGVDSGGLRETGGDDQATGT